jgi:DNA-binding SARP family transcriptional activator
MAPVLLIQLLGNLDIHYVGQPSITDLNANRLQALLAYLLIHRYNPQPRTHLAYLFWPDSADDQARTNLRNLLHLLRQALPEVDNYIQTDRQTLTWRPTQPVSLDIENFECQLDRAEVAGETGNQDKLRQALENAVELYQDDLLLSCYSDWIVPERERLRQRFINAAYRLVNLLASQGDTPHAIQTTVDLLRFDPLQEVAYRRLMEIYAQAYDLAGIQRTYQTCAALLGQELSVSPSQETQQLYRRLLTRLGAQSSSIKPRQQTHLPPGSPLPWIARQAELAQLVAVWEQVLVTGPQLVLVTGEAGLGKSRLLAEFGARVQKSGGRVAAARGYPAENRLPFAPLAAWLRSLPPPDLDEPWQGEVARLLPEIHAAPPASSGMAGLPRLRLFQALAQALLAGSQPTVLLLDDLQWIDRDSLDWLQFVLHFDERAPLLVVASLRPEELYGRRSVQNFLSALHQAAQFKELVLPPLGYKDTLRLAELARGNPLQPEAATRLFQSSLGYPFFVIEMAADGWARFPPPNEIPGDLPPLPAAIIAVLHARLERVSPAAREIVHLVAAAGDTCAYKLLVQGAGLEDRRLADILDELVDRRILMEVLTTAAPESSNSHEPAYCFANPLLRQIVWESLSAARRRLLVVAVKRAKGLNDAAS